MFVGLPLGTRVIHYPGNFLLHDTTRIPEMNIQMAVNFIH